jgi:hypothetical protein
MEELMFEITDRERFHQVELVPAPPTVIEDFLQRIEGKPYRISHQYLVLASIAAIEADEQAVILKC